MTTHKVEVFHRFTVTEIRPLVNPGNRCFCVSDAVTGAEFGYSDSADDCVRLAARLNGMPVEHPDLPRDPEPVNRRPLQLLGAVGALVLAGLSACAPARFTYREDPGVVCYQAAGGLFGGPSLQCLDRGAPDGGGK